MKIKILFGLILLCFTFVCIPVEAKTVIVEALNEYSSANPSQDYSLKLYEELKIDKDTVLEEGSVITGHFSHVIEPKRMKKNAYFVFIPDSYTIPSQGDRVVKVTTTKEAKLMYSKKCGAPSGKKVATATGSYLLRHSIPGLGMIINFSDGIIHPQEGESRLHSGGRYVAESWPFCYAMKGKEVIIAKGARAKFTFDKEIFDEDVENSDK
jgi:hypothetical protein